MVLGIGFPFGMRRRLQQLEVFAAGSASHIEHLSGVGRADKLSAEKGRVAAVGDQFGKAQNFAGLEGYPAVGLDRLDDSHLSTMQKPVADGVHIHCVVHCLPGRRSELTLFPTQHPYHSPCERIAGDLNGLR